MKGSKPQSQHRPRLFDRSIEWRDLTDKELAQAAREYLNLAEKSVRDGYDDACAAQEVIHAFNALSRVAVATRRGGGPAKQKWAPEAALRLYTMVRRRELAGFTQLDAIKEIGDLHAVPLESADSVSTTYARAKEKLRKLGILGRVEVLLALEFFRAIGAAREDVLQEVSTEKLRRQWSWLLSLPDDDLLPQDYPTIASRRSPQPWSPSNQLLGFMLGMVP